MDEKILKLYCKKNVYYKTRKAIKRLKDRDFKVLFNGENFDLIDSNGHLISGEYGLNLDQLVEYSLLEHYFTIGEQVEITAERTKKIIPEIYDTYKNEIGDVGTIKEVSLGTAEGIRAEVLLFNIRNHNKDWTKSYISGDFKSI